MDDGWYRLGEILVATIGVREGLVTIILKLLGGHEPNWGSLPLYLPGPWCYVVAVGVMAVALAALVALDKARLAKGTRTPSEE